jgi:hypothetical protein
MRSALVILFVALLAGVVVPDASARPIGILSYEELFKEADLAVIATATGSKDSGEKVAIDGWGKTEFIAVDTTFEVKGTLKGKAPGKNLTVLHFRLKDGVSVPNGPLLVTFRDKPIALDLKQAKVSLPAPEYLLFLKAPKDPKETRYEPVSGRVDPMLSVRELFPAGTGSNLARDEK